MAASSGECWGNPPWLTKQRRKQRSKKHFFFKPSWKHTARMQTDGSSACSTHICESVWPRKSKKRAPLNVHRPLLQARWRLLFPSPLKKNKPRNRAKPQANRSTRLTKSVVLHLRSGPLLDLVFTLPGMSAMSETWSFESVWLFSWKICDFAKNFALWQKRPMPCKTFCCIRSCDAALSLQGSSAQLPSPQLQS